MSPQQWCDHVCVRLHARIARETPAGLGAWDPVWDLVEAPSRALMEELARIERGEGATETAKALGVEVLAAWRRSAMQWEATGGGKAA